MRKLPDRVPETAELLVVVLGNLVADEEIVPVQLKAYKRAKRNMKKA